MARYIYIFREEMEGTEDHVEVVNSVTLKYLSSVQLTEALYQINGAHLWLIGIRLRFKHATLKLPLILICFNRLLTWALW